MRRGEGNQVAKDSGGKHVDAFACGIQDAATERYIRSSLVTPRQHARLRQIKLARPYLLEFPFRVFSHGSTNKTV